MSDKEVHLSKYKKDKNLSQSDLIKQECNNDWRVVMIYYSALHAIDSVYSNYNMHPANHEIRKKSMTMIEEFKHSSILKVAYQSLETYSRKARYDDLTIKSSTVKKAEQFLSAIENEINVHMQ